MTWRMIDDGFDVHPKVVELMKLPPGRFACAVALWTLAGCHAQRGDGTIPIEILKQIRVTSPLRSAADLVAVSLWIQIDSKTYRFHDWEDYNETVEEKSVKRKANRERQRTYRQRRNAERDALRNANVTPPRPDPSRPVQKTPTHEATSRVRRDATLFPQHGENGAKPLGTQIRLVFDSWVLLHVAKAHQDRAVLNSARKARIKARLAEGYTVERLVEALKGALADRWLMGLDPKSTRAFRGIEHILRDGSQVERLEELAGDGPADVRYDLKRGVAPPAEDFEADPIERSNRGN